MAPSFHLPTSRVLALAAIVLLVHGSYVMYNRRPQQPISEPLERQARRLSSITDLTDEEIEMAGFATDVFAEIAREWAPPVIGGGSRALLQEDEFFCLYTGPGNAGLGYGYGYTYAGVHTEVTYGYSGYGYSYSGGYTKYGYGYGYNCNQGNTDPGNTGGSPSPLPSPSGSMNPSKSVGPSGSGEPSKPLPSDSVSPSKSPIGSSIVSSSVVSTVAGTPTSVAYVIGAWSKCSKPCGGKGTQTAMVTCQNLDPAAMTTDEPLSACDSAILQQDLVKLVQSTLSTAIILQQPCNTQVCPAFMYNIGTWTPCSATCGGGTQSRTVTCVDPSTGIVAPDASCAGLSNDTSTSQVCNTATCTKYYWSVSAWVGCAPGTCGGVSTRTVECRDQTGVVSADLCKDSAMPSLTDDCTPCDLCTNPAACNGNGMCANSICTCNSGWIGPSCAQAVPAGCTGTQIDKLGNCCDVIDANTQLCCAAGAKLDKTGTCCTGIVDGCRVCNGQGIGYDIQGNCCIGTSAKLTPAETCCTSGVIDECGVCDGDSSSCKLKITTKMAMSPAAAALTEEQRNAQLVTYFAGPSMLNTQEARITCTSTLTTSRRRLHTGSAAIVNLEVAPSTTAQAADTSMAGTITITDASAVLAAALSAGGNGLFTVTDILAISRGPVCGNAVCETGELLSAADLQKTQAVLDSEGKCRADCPYVVMTCDKPATTVGDTTVDCGGNGYCQVATGDCSCDAGYSGFACGTCQSGFAPSSVRTCQQLITKAVAAVPVPPPSTPSTADISSGNLVVVPKKGSSSKKLKTVLPAVLVPCGVVILAGLFLAFMHAKRVKGTTVVDTPAHINTNLAPFNDVESSNPQLTSPPAVQTTFNPLNPPPMAATVGPAAASGADLFMPVPTFLSEKDGSK